MAGNATRTGQRCSPPVARIFRREACGLRPSPRAGRHCVPARRMAAITGDSLRRNDFLWRTRPARREPQGVASRGLREWRQPAAHRDSVSPRNCGRRISRRFRRRPARQADVACARIRGVGCEADLRRPLAPHAFELAMEGVDEAADFVNRRSITRRALLTGDGTVAGR